MAFQTEFTFTLPRGYIDDTGMIHREGTMRLANAADEILPLKDPRVQQNPGDPEDTPDHSSCESYHETWFSSGGGYEDGREIIYDGSGVSSGSL